ncbi:MAG: response regulator transcription factor [Planctomycetota bacterium]
MNATTINVTLIEDNPEYSEVIKLALQSQPGIRLTDQFGTAEMALRGLSNATLSAMPHLIILDIRLPGISGLDALPELIKAAPHAKILMLTQSNQEEDVINAIAHGAAGYLLKSATLEQLVDGIKTVVSGGAPIDPGVARYILDSLRDAKSEPAPPDSGERRLSKRELQILTLIAEGCVKKEIASRLEISYTTVDTHVGRIYSKLNVTNAPSAVNKAHRLQLFKPEE